VAASAARPFERRVVGVGIVREQQFAQQDIGAETGCHQQRLTAYPAQPGFDGQLFFEQRGRVDERPPRQIGAGGAKCIEHPAEHSLDRRVVVGRTGIGSYFRAVSGRVALACAVFVTHGADHGRTCALNQFARVGALLDIALHVGQRRLVALAEPCPQHRLVLDQVPARSQAAKVEPRIGGKFFDVLMVEHFIILVQK